jgi:ribosome modulation factor
MDVAEDPTVYLEEDPTLYEALMEGYDARNQGAEYEANPYDKRGEPKKYRVWLAGFRACRHDELRHRIRLDAATGDVYGIEIRAPRGDHVCTPCQREDETVYSIEEALEAPPIPHEHCETGQCRCTYVYITNPDHPGL